MTICLSQMLWRNRYYTIKKKKKLKQEQPPPFYKMAYQKPLKIMTHDCKSIVYQNNQNEREGARGRRKYIYISDSLNCAHFEAQLYKTW